MITRAEKSAATESKQNSSKSFETLVKLPSTLKV